VWPESASAVGSPFCRNGRAYASRTALLIAPHGALSFAARHLPLLPKWA